MCGSLLLARVAPARLLSDDDAHLLTVEPTDCRWLAVTDTEQGWAFLQSATDLGYAVLDVAPVEQGWGLGINADLLGYTVPSISDVPVVA